MFHMQTFESTDAESLFVRIDKPVKFPRVRAKTGLRAVSAVLASDDGALQLFVMHQFKSMLVRQSLA